MMSTIQLLDTIALLEDITVEDRTITRGAVGAVVEILAPDVFEVEFCDDQGRTLAFASLSEAQLLQLHPPQAVRNVA
jgi:hypothetical protein